MKKLKHILSIAALVFCCSMVVKADTKAAQITGVKQTDANKSSVSITCNADLQASYYVLYVSTDRQNWVEKDYATSPNNLDASGLSAGSTYYVAVRGATDYDIGASWDNKIWQWCTDLSAPVEVVTAPDVSDAKLVQSGATLNSITLSQSGVSGANYYRVGSSFSYSNSQFYANSTTATITVGSLKPNTKYDMHAFACRKALTTDFIAHSSYDSGSVSAKTLTGKINTKNFGITNAWANSNSYSFGVSTGFVADGYQFQFQDMKGKVKKEVIATSAFASIAPSVTVSDFINGTFYKYRVRSYVNCGQNKYSQWSDFRYVGVPKKMGGVSRSTLRGKTKTLNVSWKKVSGAKKYVVYISKSKDGGYKKVKTLNSKKTSIKITKMGKKKLKKNTTYYVKLVVQSKVGKKTVSSDVRSISVAY